MQTVQLLPRGKGTPLDPTSSAAAFVFGKGLRLKERMGKVIESSLTRCLYIVCFKNLSQRILSPNIHYVSLSRTVSTRPLGRSFVSFKLLLKHSAIFISLAKWL